MQEPAQTAETPEQRRFELARDLAEGPMAILSLAALALVVLDVAVPLSARAQRAVSFGLWVTWAAFATEYFAFLILAPDKGRYLRRNLFALLTVLLPFLRFFRVMRAARAVRAIRATRIANLTRRGAIKLRSLLQWSAFAYFAAVSLVLTFLAAAGEFALEADAPGASIRSYGQALWWSFGAITTIGTSLEPVTLEGRLFAAPLYVLGLGIQAYLGGVIAASLIGQQRHDEAGPTSEAKDDPIAGKLDLVLERLDRLDGIHDQGG